MFTFDQTPLLYWAATYLLACLLILSVENKSVSGKAWIGLSILLFFAARLPIIVFNRELNPDESQMIGHAITLYFDPVYWKSVDGNTLGPLSVYPLVLPKILGFQVDYTSVRLFGAFLNIGTMLFFSRACWLWFGESAGRIALLVPSIFLGFTRETDFVHYSSEQVSLLLLAICLWLVACISQNRNIRLYGFLLGMTAGMIPFAKLQAVPQAIVLVLFGGWLIFRHSPDKRFLKNLLPLLVGGVTFPLLVFGWAIRFEVFSDLFDFYVFGNVIYAGKNNITDIPGIFLKLLMLSPNFTAYCLILLLPVVLAAGRLRRHSLKDPEIPQWQVILSAVFLGASIYAATKSGNSFVHYLNLCIYPVALASTLALRYTRVPDWLCPGLLLAWFAFRDGSALYSHRVLNPYPSVDARELSESPVVKEQKKYTTPGDRMVVWGWQPRYYVEAQLPQGTAELNSERCIFEHPMREVYRERYMRDLKRNRPTVFIDAVGKNSVWVQDTLTQSYRSFPELAAYIDQNYTMKSTYDGDKLFIRNTPAP